MTLPLPARGWKRTALLLLAGPPCLFFLFNCLGFAVARLYPPSPPTERPYYSDLLTTTYAFDHRKQIMAEVAASKTEYAPFLGWRRLPFRGRTLSVDQNGDRVHPATGVGSDARVLRFFGGSTLWGAGVDDAGTIPAYFQELHPEWRVVNHGELGFNSRQNLERLINLYSNREQVDVVVFYVGVNDVDWLVHDERDLPGHSSADVIRKRLSPRRLSILGRALEILFYEYSMDLFERLFTEDGAPEAIPWDEEHDNEAWIDRVTDLLLGTWEIAHDLVAARGGRFFVVLQPIPSVGSPRLDLAASSYSPEFGAYSARCYDALRAKVRSLGYEWFRDLTHSLDSQTEVFYFDWCHVTELANERIAKAIDALGIF